MEKLVTLSAAVIIYLNSSFAFGADFLSALSSKELIQFIKESKTQHTYLGVEKTKNVYERFHNPAGHVQNPLIIINGAEDPLPCWYKVIYQTAIQNGFKEIYLIEIRGQGLAERVRKNSQKAIHLNDFKNYYEDMLAALQHIQANHKIMAPSFILSHSTGSAIITNTLPMIKKDLPQFNIEAMSFWAPLIKLPISSALNNFFVRNFLSFIDRIYFLITNKLLIARSYQPEVFDKNTLTTSSEDFDMMQSLKFDFGYGSTGVSLKWVLEALKELNSLNLNKIEIPTLILKAEDEVVVDNQYKVQNPLIKTEIIKSAKHALHMEKESIRREVTEKTLRFFQSQ